MITRPSRFGAADTLMSDLPGPHRNELAYDHDILRCHTHGIWYGTIAGFWYKKQHARRAFDKGIDVGCYLHPSTALPGCIVFITATDEGTVSPPSRLIPV